MKDNQNKSTHGLSSKLNRRDRTTRGTNSTGTETEPPGPNVHERGVPEGDGEEYDAEKKCEERVTDIFSHLVKCTHLQIQGQQTKTFILGRIRFKQTTSNRGQALEGGQRSITDHL